MPLQSVLDYMAARQTAHLGTVAAGRTATITGRNVKGISCRICDYGDSDAAAKTEAIDKAVQLLVQRGYSLPNSLTFHLSSRTDGFKAPTEAFARNNSGSVSVEVFLGPMAIYSPPQAQSEGIAHKIQQYGLGDYTTAVVVHELGHVLHDIESEAFFWSPEAGNGLKGSDVNVAFDQISAYSASNPKEVVAEVFAAHNMGLKFSGTQVYELYAKFKGPVLLPQFKGVMFRPI